MGVDYSTHSIHQIDESPEQKEKLLKAFREMDTNNDSRINREELIKLISKSIDSETLAFSDIIFAIFSDDGTYISREKFCEFCDSMQYLVLDQSNPKSLTMRAFLYADKNRNGYLGVTELQMLVNLLYKSKPNAPKFKKGDAEKIIKSEHTKSSKGLNKLEFIRMFQAYHPITSSNQNKSLTSYSPNKAALIKEQAQHRRSSLSEVSRSKRVITYESPSPTKIDERTIKKWKDDFSSVDSKNTGALNQKRVAILLRHQCILPSSYAYLITEIFGEDHYVNFEGYRDLLMSLRMKKENDSSFWKKVFNRYDLEKKKYLTINECIQFGRDICLNEISNSRQSWIARLKECQTIYHFENINFEYFHQIMFSLQ